MSEAARKLQLADELDVEGRHEAAFLMRTKDSDEFCRRKRPRPSRRRAAEQRDEVPSFQLIELHSIRQPGRIVGYRIGEDQSGGNGTILLPVSRWRGRPMSQMGSKCEELRVSVFLPFLRLKADIRRASGGRASRWSIEGTHRIDVRRGPVHNAWGPRARGLRDHGRAE
jgi:hypothetical protein